MNAKEQNNMEKELEKNLEETPNTGDTPTEGEMNAPVENVVAEEVVQENVLDEVKENTESEEIVSETSSTEIVDQQVVKDENKRTSNKRILQGVVVSNKSDKTIVIKVVRQVAHPLYKKYYKKTNKFMAHDPNNDCNIGDTVKVKEARPMSKRKRWELIEIVDRAK